MNVYATVQLEFEKGYFSSGLWKAQKPLKKKEYNGKNNRSYHLLNTSTSTLC